MISSSLAEDARAHSLLGVAIQPLSYLPICLYALEELSIHLQIFDKLSLRGYDPSVSYSWTWPLCSYSCGCTMAYSRGPMRCTWARCWPYPITAAAAAIAGQLGLRLPRVHQSGRDGHQPCLRWLNYIRIYHLFNLMMENNASCIIDIDLIISIHRIQHVKSPIIIIININCVSPSFIIIITRS